MTDTQRSKKFLTFSCENCDFTCIRKSQYTRHLSTGKHEILTNTDSKSSKKFHTYTCSCGKSYKYRQSLYSHKKKCKFEEIINEVVESYEVIGLGNDVTKEEKKEEENDDPSYKEMFMTIMKENKELITLVKEQQKQIGDIIPKIGNNTTTHNNNNTTNNNNFNLQVFLNETCKDALNIRDFINSLSVQCSEMKEIQNIGFVEVATKLLIKELSGMDITKRPIHCSDLKRETLYIKDNDVWGKESENKPTMLHMISQMQKESYTTLDNWANKHPGYIKPDHPCHQTYMDTWGDICTLDPVKDVNKISKRIAKEVLIDKEKNR